MPNLVQSSLHTGPHLILLATQWGKYCCCVHISNEGTEVVRLSNVPKVTKLEKHTQDSNQSLFDFRPHLTLFNVQPGLFTEQNFLDDYEYEHIYKI